MSEFTVVVTEIQSCVRECRVKAPSVEVAQYRALIGDVVTKGHGRVTILSRQAVDGTEITFPAPN